MNSKRIHCLLFLLFLVVSVALTSCGDPSSDAGGQAPSVENAGAANASDPGDAAKEETRRRPVGISDMAESERASDRKNVLVVFFSATGTTKSVAERIASITNADIYEIKAAQKYTEDDLNWHDSDSRTTREQNDKKVRPKIGSEPVSLEGYSTVFLGYPIWWGEEPRIMDTFAESYDFSGKTMIPFCTSGSSGIGSSGKNLEKLTSGATWLDGKRFGGSVSETDLQAWIDGLK